MHQKHLLIFGGGSAAVTAVHKALAAGWRVTMANRGLPLGGTCLNVGCVPSKWFIRAAEAWQHAHHSRFDGIKPAGGQLDFSALQAGKQALIDSLRSANYDQVLPNLDGLRLIHGKAKLLDAPHPTMQVNGEEIEGDFALLATGCRPAHPDIPGLDLPGILTNESLFDLQHVPASLTVLGGSYIALECAQMMSRFGAEVTVIQRSDYLLSDQPAYLGKALRQYLEEDGLTVHCGTALQEVRSAEDKASYAIEFEQKAQSQAIDAARSRKTLHSEQVFNGLGRRGNSDGLAVDCDSHGYVIVDSTGHTSREAVYAAGDITGDRQFVYSAAYEADGAVEHMLSGNGPSREYEALPWVVFTDPQAAGVGLDEFTAAEMGYEADTAELPATRWPRLRVANDTRGFLRLVRDRKTGQLLGARILCAEAGDLAGELSLAMRHKIPVAELARTLHPYLTLAEGIERAAGRFDPL